MDWIWFRGSVFAKPEESWERWWYEEQDRLRTTGLLGIIFEIILDLRFFFFQYGIVYQLGIAAGSKSVAVYILSWIYVIVYAGDKYTYLLSACTVSGNCYRDTYNNRVTGVYEFSVPRSFHEFVGVSSDWVGVSFDCTSV
ncbi:hypothetical protein L1887_30145 [Cichorium endivia]|nr:hypothetical protein L1887_30145 [Cichorium endivia]